MRIQAFVMSCPERNGTLQQTLTSLYASGWAEKPVTIMDDGACEKPLDRIHRTWRRMLKAARDSVADYVLLLEDDLVFGAWFAHNIHAWKLLNQQGFGGAFYASLYNPGRPYIIRHETECYQVADSRWVWGSQALLLSPATVRYIDRNWNAAEGNPDMRMPNVARTITPIYYHVPSLVDHAATTTTWGGIEHAAIDFDPEWRAPDPT